MIYDKTTIIELKNAIHNVNDCANKLTAMLFRFDCINEQYLNEQITILSGSVLQMSDALEDYLTRKGRSKCKCGGECSCHEGNGIDTVKLP